MTVETTNYYIGSNQPLHHSRFLWDMIAVSSTSVQAGDTGDATLALNDYTHQRWVSSIDPTAEASFIIMEPGATVEVDMVFIAAHNLFTAGATVKVWTAPETAAPFTFTERASVTPTDNGAIALLFNNFGVPHQIGAIKVGVDSGGASSPLSIGILRAGVALQMYRPLGNTEPIGLRTEKTMRQRDSETGQPLVRTVQRRRKSAGLAWPTLPSDWYRANFQPFAETLPERPFGFVQNAVSMPESVVWGWTNDDPMPQTSGGKKNTDISMKIIGFDG